MSWTTYQDVIDRWVGPGAPTDDDLVAAIILDAEAIILSEYPRIQERIDADEISLDVIKLVTVRMVSRILRNPENLTYWQQTTGPFGQARNFGSTNQDLWMSEQEKTLLSPKQRGKAFEVNQGYAANYGLNDLWLEISN
jgi:hypothetical protein